MNNKPRILMFGPGLAATSGISAVVNNWLQVGLAERLDLEYISTLDDYVPGRYLRKTLNAIRAYAVFVVKSLRHVDLVHIHLSYGMSFYRKLIVFRYARLRGLKTVIHLHGSTFREFYENSRPFQKKLIRSLFDHADAVFVLSEGWRDFIRQISSNENIYILYNGALIEQYSNTRHQGKTVNIAFMGRLGQRKGTYDLLEAFRRLSNEVPEAKLVLGGDGEVDKVKSFVRDKHLEKQVEVLGWVSGERKTEVFNKADIYALPSYNEGLPGSVLEAMAAAKPVVSTPVGGIPEAVIEGKNGFLVEPGDVEALYLRLLELCKDAQLREQMGNESRRIIQEKFDIREIVTGLVDIYKELAIR